MTHTVQLYLTFEVAAAADAAAAAALLGAALQAHTFSSLLLAPAPGATLPPALLKTLVTAAQKAGVAALIADDAQLARTLKADGVHLSWSKDIAKRFREARETLGERYILGADAGRSRHDAMELGEAGADYVAFGIPAHVEDRATAAERQLGLVAWWSEIFEIPCVAFNVDTPEQASRAAHAHADFVAIPLDSTLQADAAVERIRNFAKALSAAEAAA